MSYRANRMLKEIRPLGEATLYAFDPAGHLTTRTNAKGEVRQYTFDAANRRTQEQHQTSTGTIARTINYSYDERGLLASYTDTGDTNLANLLATANSASYSYDSKAQKTRIKGVSDDFSALSRPHAPSPPHPTPDLWIYGSMDLWDQRRLFCAGAKIWR